MKEEKAMNENKIIQLNTKQEYLLGTIQALLKNTTQKEFIVSAPTGTGKTILGMQLIDDLDGEAYYLTPQNALISQIQADDAFNHDNIIEFKGKNNYRCTLLERKLTAPEFNGIFGKKSVNIKYKEINHSYSLEIISVNEAPCSYDGIDEKYLECSSLKKTLEEQNPAECHYTNAFWNATNAKVFLTNIDCFIANRNFIRQKRTIAIIDECQNLDKVLEKYAEFSLTPKKEIESELNLSQKIDLASEEAGKLRHELLFLEEEIKNISRKDFQELKQLRRKKNRLEKEIEKLDLFLQQPENYFVVFEKNKNILVFTPKNLKFLFNFIRSKCDAIVFMSATPSQNKSYWDRLGIEFLPENVLCVESSFKKENRKLVSIPIMKVNYSNMAEAYEEMMPKFRELLLSVHGKEKGVIHAVSGASVKLISSLFEKYKIKRNFFQYNGGNPEEKTKILNEWKNSGNGVLICVGMHEGFDWKDDLCRFQIFPKMPFTSLNEIAKLKTEEFSGWYPEQAITSLVHAFVRGIRNENDFCTNYIFDSNFLFLVKHFQYLFPSWFLTAVVFEK